MRWAWRWRRLQSPWSVHPRRTKCRLHVRSRFHSRWSRPMLSLCRPSYGLPSRVPQIKEMGDWARRLGLWGADARHAPTLAQRSTSSLKRWSWAWIPSHLLRLKRSLRLDGQICIKVAWSFIESPSRIVLLERQRNWQWSSVQKGKHSCLLCATNISIPPSLEYTRLGCHGSVLNHDPWSRNYLWKPKLLSVACRLRDDHT